MKIRQEENTPIGNYFHDSGVKTIFDALATKVDSFDVDTDQITAWCDIVIRDLRGLQGLVSKCEKEWIKKQHEEEVEEMKHRGAE